MKLAGCGMGILPSFLVSDSRPPFFPGLMNAIDSPTWRTSSLREASETKQSDSDDHPAMGVGDNFVRVMTMHKSKGLESGK